MVRKREKKKESSWLAGCEGIIGGEEGEAAANSRRKRRRNKMYVMSSSSSCDFVRNRIESGFEK